MLIKTKGIVFKTKKYSETSVIADIYTEEKGLRSYIISGVRTQKAKVSAGLLQIMTPVDLVAYHREDKDLTRLKEIKPLHIFKTLPYDVRKSAVGMFMIEIARKTIHGHEAHPELFGFLLGHFLYLDETPHFANLHLHFMLGLSGFLGFMPGGAFSEKAPFFDLQEGLFTEHQPIHPFWVKPEVSQKLSSLMHLPKENCHEVQMHRDERRVLLKHLLDYYRLHIENFPAVHSHQILEEILA